MSCSQPLAEKLKSRGFRMTSQRHAILHVLKSSGGHLSPSQVFERAHVTSPGMTETTVYRTLEFLAENDIVQSRMTSGGHLVYEIAKAGHYHLVCRVCGKEMEIQQDQLEPLYSELEASTGFRAIGSQVTFFGVCPDCQ
jgi:Fur family ferric uptake transcriptional regulator